MAKCTDENKDKKIERNKKEKLKLNARFLLHYVMLAHLLLSAHTLPTPRFISDIDVVVVVVATVITLVYPSGKLADFLFALFV